MRVTFITVASSKFWRPFNAMSVSMPPLGVLGMAAVLRMHGHEVRVMDMFLGLSNSEFRRNLEEFMPDLVGISCHTESYDSAVKVTRMVRSLAPGARIVMGGPHVTFTIDQTFAECEVDYVVTHEGENTLLELLIHLEAPEAVPAERVRGLAWRDGDKVRVNSPRPFMTCLTALPLPDLSLIDLKRYRASFALVTSRGCPGNCIYCSARAMWGSKYRARPAEHIFSEIFVRAKQTGRTFFSIPDDTFTANTRRVREFCRLLINSGLGLRWHCESRADVMTEDLLDLLKEADCEGVQFGIETADGDVLASLNKGISLDRVEELVAYAQAIGLTPRCSFMLGHHTDTPETIRRTVDMVKRFCLQYEASCAISASTPYPGTYLYENRDELGLTLHSTRWEDHIFTEPMVSGRGFTVDDVREALFEVITFVADREHQKKQAETGEATGSGR